MKMLAYKNNNAFYFCSFQCFIVLSALLVVAAAAPQYAVPPRPAPPTPVYRPVPPPPSPVYRPAPPPPTPVYRPAPPPTPVYIPAPPPPTPVYRPAPPPTPVYSPAPVPAYGAAPVYSDVPPAYDFAYAVSDSYHGVDFGANENRNG